MEKENIQTSNKKILRGKVVSNKMKDTIVIEVSRFVKHSKYKKFIKKTKKHMAHDKGNTKQIGDLVSIQEVRPISKRKSFILIENQEKK